MTPDFLLPAAYHFVSSSLVGLLAWRLMASTDSRSSEHQSGSTSSTYWRRWGIPLLCSVWAHILVFDIIEHGEPPKIAEGISELVRALGF
jgi:hypothetical protein